MKMTSLIAGVAIAALTAGVASAQTAVSNATYVNGANGTNIGTATTPVDAAFDVSGTVDAACVISTSSGALNDLDFGTIGIYADGSTSVESAFTMTGPRNGHSRTNLAGCNTANTVTLTKSIEGLTTDDTGGYDTNVFQANIPYSVSARYTAVDESDIGPGVIDNYVSIGTAGSTDSANHGAWKSGIAIRVDLPVTAKALIAGEYTDEVTLSIEAAL